MNVSELRTFHFPRMHEKLRDPVLLTKRRMALETLCDSYSGSEKNMGSMNTEFKSKQFHSTKRKKIRLNNVESATDVDVQICLKQEELTQRAKSENLIPTALPNVVENECKSDSNAVNSSVLMENGIQCQWTSQCDSKTEPKVVVQLSNSPNNCYQQLSALKDSDEEGGLTLKAYEPKLCSFKRFPKHILPTPIIRPQKLRVSPVKRKRPAKYSARKAGKSNIVMQRNSRCRLNFNILRGNGDCLKDIHHIAQKFENEEIDSIVLLAFHRVLFDIHGSCLNESSKQHTKENILKFSGYRFPKKSIMYIQRKAHLKNLDSDVFNQIASILFGPSFSTEINSINRILEFLMNPRETQKVKQENLIRNVTVVPHIKQEMLQEDEINSIKKSFLERKAPFLRVSLKRLEQHVINLYASKISEISDDEVEYLGSNSHCILIEDSCASDVSDSIKEQNIKYAECLAQTANPSYKEDGKNSGTISDHDLSITKLDASSANKLEKPLKNIDDIRFKIECSPPEDLSELHDVLYAKQCDTWEIHLRVLDFDGFSFETGSIEYDLRKCMMSYMNIESVKKIARLLCLIDSQQPTSKKEELITSIINFLINPNERDILVDSSNFNKECAVSNTSHSNECSTLSERNSSESLLNNTTNTEEFSLPCSLNTRLNSIPSDPTDSGHEMLETTLLHEEYNCEISLLNTESFRQSFSSSSEDESLSFLPLAAFSGHPSDGQLKADIHEIVVQNLLTMSLKGLVRAVYAKYPDFNLRYRSKFIKSRARKVLSSLHREPVRTNSA